MCVKVIRVELSGVGSLLHLYVGSGYQACMGSAFDCWVILPALFLRVSSFLWVYSRLLSLQEAMEDSTEIAVQLYYGYGLWLWHQNQKPKSHCRNRTLIVIVTHLLSSVCDGLANWQCYLNRANFLIQRYIPKQPQWLAYTCLKSLSLLDPISLVVTTPAISLPVS